MKQTLLLLSLLLVLNSCYENQQETETNNKHTSLGTPVPPTPDRDPVNLQYLEKYLGQQPAEVSLWHTEPLHSRLQELLGDQYYLFLGIMQEAGPLKEERVLYTIGTHPDPKIRGLGILLVDVENNSLHISLVFDHKREQFQTIGADFYVPREVTQYLENALN
jgi:hypothetical protein